jgi:nucleotide-binding universal stress UspA family protein
MHRALILLLALVCAVSSAAEPPKPSPHELLTAATSPPSPTDSFPVLPSLSTEMRGRIAGEIGREPVRRAFELLDARQKRNVDWFKAVEILEQEKATWSLQACLVHPHEDVQIHALRALERLRSKEGVPFLLIYGDYMAVIEPGSENATIHGIVHESIAKTLSAITGVEVRLDGQDPEGLRRGLLRWTQWLVEQRRSAAP